MLGLRGLIALGLVCATVAQQTVVGSWKVKAANAQTVVTDTTKTAKIATEFAKWLGIKESWMLATYEATDSNANIKVSYTILVPKDNTDANLAADKLKEKMTFTKDSASATAIVNALKASTALNDATIAFVEDSAAPTVTTVVAQDVKGTIKFKAANAKTVAADSAKTAKIKTELAKIMGISETWLTTTFKSADSDANIEVAYTVVVPADNSNVKLMADELKKQMTFGTTDKMATDFETALRTALSDTTIDVVSNTAPTVTTSTAKTSKAVAGSVSIAMAAIVGMTASF